MRENFIGQRISALLIKNNMSERKLGEKIGLSDSYINKVVNGHLIPPLYKLELICAAFGINLQEFFAGPESLTTNQYLFLNELDGLSEEDIQFLLMTVRHLKKRNTISRRGK